MGKNVTRFKPGDEVFGGSRGAFGEYLVASENSNLVLKPDSVSFVEAASSPVAAITALQIAKSMGAEVTGVCSTRNLDLVRSIGADHVIDYTREDYTKSGKRYDLIIDIE